MSGRKPINRPIITPDSPNAQAFADQRQVDQFMMLLVRHGQHLENSAGQVTLCVEDILRTPGCMPKKRAPKDLRFNVAEEVEGLLGRFQRLDVETQHLLQSTEQRTHMQAMKRILEGLKPRWDRTVAALKGVMETPYSDRELALQLDEVVKTQVNVLGRTLQEEAEKAAEIKSHIPDSQVPTELQGPTRP